MKRSKSKRNASHGGRTKPAGQGTSAAKAGPPGRRPLPKGKAGLAEKLSAGHIEKTSKVTIRELPEGKAEISLISDGKTFSSVLDAESATELVRDVLVRRASAMSPGDSIEIAGDDEDSLKLIASTPMSAHVSGRLAAKAIYGKNGVRLTISLIPARPLVRSEEEPIEGKALEGEIGSGDVPLAAPEQRMLSRIESLSHRLNDELSRSLPKGAKERARETPEVQGKQEGRQQAPSMDAKPSAPVPGIKIFETAAELKAYAKSQSFMLELLSRLDKNPSDTKAIAGVRVVAGSISESAGLLKLDEIRQISQKIDTVFSAYSDRGAADPKLLPIIVNAAKQLQRLVDRL